MVLMMRQKRIKGWVDKIRETNEGLQIDIQCDDGLKGHRGNTIHEKLGEIIIWRKMKDQ